MTGNSYLNYYDLDAYKLASQYSDESWDIYDKMDWRIKKIIGDQWITSVDSVGANIAEGCGRFHYLDKNKFFYNARASLYESQHWLSLCRKRLLMDEEKYASFIELSNKLLIKINSLIKSQYEQKSKENN